MTFDEWWCSVYKQPNEPYVIIALVSLVAVPGSLLLAPLLKEYYTYLFIPLFWTLLALRAFLCRCGHYRARVRSNTIFWLSVSAAAYIFIYYVSGIFDSYAHSPYDISFTGILFNLALYGVPILAREYVRAYVLCSLSPRKKKTRLVCTLVCISFALSELNFRYLVSKLGSPAGVFEQLGGRLMPALITSLLLTFAAYHAGSMPGIIYKSITEVTAFLIPIVPNSRWITAALVGSLLPFLTYLIVGYDVGVTNRTVTRKQMREDNPAKWLPTFAVLLLFVCFVVGLFPIQPVTIASGSMEPAIMTGDMVLVNKSDTDALEVGDVIEYSKGSYYVIHRITEIHTEEGVTKYTTKGDNNNSADSEPVLMSQIRGKVVGRVPYVGWLTLWMHSAHVDKTAENVEVETGGTYD